MIGYPSRLPPVAITGWTARASLGWLGSVPLPSPDTRRPAGDAVAACHLRLDGRFGPTVPLGLCDDVAPLPGRWEHRQSAVARLVLATLEPLAPLVQEARQAVGAQRLAILLGTSTAGVDRTESAMEGFIRSGTMPPGYDFEQQHAFHAPLEILMEEVGAEGPAFVVSTACSSAAKALASAQRLLAADLADAVLVAGVDALCRLTVRGFHGLGIISEAPTRPFSAERRGLSLGEGAACFLLEPGSSPRSEQAAGWLLGVGESSDAHHMTAPHPEGHGAKAAMAAALAMSGSRAADVGYVNAHGTGTAQNDPAEGRAIAELLGDVAVSSSKGAIGHLLGAAGALETAITLDALARRQLPTSIGAAPVDEAIPARVLTTPEAPRAPRAISNSFAFGGSNAAVLVAAGDDRPPGSHATLDRAYRSVHCSAVSYWDPWRAGVHALLEPVLLEQPVPATEHPRPPAGMLPTRARGRSSALQRLFAEVLGRLGEREDLARAPLFFASAYGEVETTERLLREMFAGDGQISPLRFQASVHNAGAGVLGIHLGNRAPASAVAAGHGTVAMALLEVQAYLRCHGGEAFLVVADEGSCPPVMPGPFPPVAAGFRLSADAGPGITLGVPRRLIPAEPRATACPELAGNPVAAVAELARAVSTAMPGPVPLTPGGDWIVDVGLSV